MTQENKMPERIWAYTLNNYRIWDNELGTKKWAIEYIRADRHEELKAIAEKMADALRDLVKYFNNTEAHNCNPVVNGRLAITEYNKYKGE